MTEDNPPMQYFPNDTHRHVPQWLRYDYVTLLLATTVNISTNTAILSDFELLSVYVAASQYVFMLCLCVSERHNSRFLL